MNLFSKWSICLTALLLGACSQNTSGIDLSIDSINAQPVVKIDNHNLANKLVLNDIKTKVVNDLLVVHASAISTTDTDQTLQYKFYWFDQFGFEVERDGTPWRPLKLHGHQHVTVQATAPSASAAQAHIYIREVVKQ
ncbi:YcfL family protein [Motilimonas cestriensis]|uniref:YcfL family protein n=1 Tax=Motilimonas cestriensis TaxID=2742685 RepID=A0ABS8W4U1_9GAMM|nr:YcfL family protein [Motilimonas cestriensis]MCE2593310.1 YcfL family protein [Motilimonas cestriensis]